MLRLTSQQENQARADAKHIWQGEWSRRILFLVAAYGVVALLLLVIGDAGDTGDTSGWNTPVLFLYVGGVSVAMVLSHRRWFGRLEADLERGVAEQAEGRVLVPHPLEAFFKPSFRYAVIVDEERFLTLRRHALEFVPDRDYSVAFLSSTGIILEAQNISTEANRNA